MIDLSVVSILNILPQNLSQDPNVQMMAAAVDEELRRVIATIPNVAIIEQMVLKKITDNALLDMLAWQFHVDFYDATWPIEKKQTAVMSWLDWHKRKGITETVEEVVTAFIADALIEQWFEYGGNAYTFRILTSLQDISEESLATLLTAIFSVKNTRSWLDYIRILREAKTSLYLGTAIVQAVRISIDINVDANLEKASFYYASFVVQRPIITIGG